MKFLKAVPVTDSTLISSTLTETESAYNAATTYALAAQVRKNHRVYESKQSGNTGHDPETDDGTWWFFVRPTNPWAMFDQSVGSSSVGVSPITVVITPNESFNSIGFMGLVAESVQISVVVSAVTVYDKTYTMNDKRLTMGWWEYFFAPIDRSSTLVVEDLPPTGTITVTINGTACGAMLIGRMSSVGNTLDKPELSALDYTTKNTNGFGVTTVTERPTVSKISAEILIDDVRLDGVYHMVSTMSATLVMWIVDESGKFSSLTTLGYRGDFSISPTRSDAGFCRGRIAILGVI